MSMVLGRRLKVGVSDFDHEIRQYLSMSRRFRSRMRSGVIIVVDKASGIEDFLDSVVKRFGTGHGIVRISDVSDVGKAISSVGPSRVKMLAVESSMVGLGDGCPLPVWVEKEYPEIPVIVFNCGPKEERLFEKRFSSRVGLVKKDVPLASFIEETGLPSCCRQLVSST